MACVHALRLTARRGAVGLSRAADDTCARYDTTDSHGVNTPGEPHRSGDDEGRPLPSALAVVGGVAELEQFALGGGERGEEARQRAGPGIR